MSTTATGAGASRPLVTSLEATLRAMAFESRLTVTPRRLAQIAAECAASFEGFAAGAGQQAEVRLFGRRLAEAGIGHGPILAVVEALHEAGAAPDPTLAARYATALLGGYMAGREAYLLSEQERTRLALERARAHALS